MLSDFSDFVISARNSVGCEFCTSSFPPVCASMSRSTRSTMKCKQIRFTQREIGARFKDGQSLDELVRQLLIDTDKAFYVRPLRFFFLMIYVSPWTIADLLAIS